jgi:hypothetical protein
MASPQTSHALMASLHYAIGKEIEKTRPWIGMKITDSEVPNGFAQNVVTGHIGGIAQTFIQMVTNAGTDFTDVLFSRSLGFGDAYLDQLKARMTEGILKTQTFIWLEPEDLEAVINWTLENCLAYFQYGVALDLVQPGQPTIIELPDSLAEARKREWQ